MRGKSKLRLLNYTIAGALSMMIWSCTYDVNPSEPVPPIPDTVSYSQDMQPFFDVSCVSCHNGGGIPLDLSPGVSYDALIAGGYVDVAQPESSLLYTKIAPGGTMVQYSTSSETAMTLKWIELGAENN
jgi:hypothetical protein